MTRSFFLPAAVVVTLAGASLLRAAEPQFTPEGVAFFEKRVRPILQQHCVKCHGGEKPKGKLRLETLEGAIKGAKSGAVIVPGKSGESSLVYAVAHVGDEDDFMPPPNNKANIAQLTKEQVALIRAWIDQGAK